jgi:hypothetical protein
LLRDELAAAARALAVRGGLPAARCRPGQQLEGRRHTTITSSDVAGRKRRFCHSPIGSGIVETADYLVKLGGLLGAGRYR